LPPTNLLQQQLFHLLPLSLLLLLPLGRPMLFRG